MLSRRARRFHTLVATLSVFVCVTASTFAVGNDRALYVGGTLERMEPPPTSRAESVAGALLGGVTPPPKIEGRIILTTEGEMQFDAGRRGRVVIPYATITSLEYGLETGRRTPKGKRLLIVIPWDPTEQFTKNAHNLLTITYHSESEGEQAIVLELGKSLVRPTLEALERRTGKTMEFLNVEACMQLRSNADACGYGQPGELKGLKKVYVEGGIPPEGRKIILAEIESSNASLEVVDTLDGAEILLRFRSRRSLDPNCPCEGGRGEVLVQGERPRVVLVFTGMKKGVWGKNPTEDFGRTFVNAVRAANGLAPRRD